MASRLTSCASRPAWGLVARSSFDEAYLVSVLNQMDEISQSYFHGLPAPLKRRSRGAGNRIYSERNVRAILHGLQDS